MFQEAFIAKIGVIIWAEIITHLLVAVSQVILCQPSGGQKH